MAVETFHESALEPWYRARAYGQSALSGMIDSSPALTKLLMITDTPSHHAVRWYRAKHQRVADIRQWAVFPGNPRSKLFAKQYKSTGLLGVDTEALQAQLSETGGRPGVAYPLGRSVMVGMLPADVPFGESADYPGMSLVGMGIGRRDLVASVGVVMPDDHRFVVPGGADVVALATFDNKSFSEKIPRL